MEKVEISEWQMIRDLKESFPGIYARPASLLSVDYAGCPGVWTGGDAEISDGVPIFWTSGCPDSDMYDGPVHGKFVEWLSKRGWGWERHDGEAFVLFPDSHWDF